MKVSIKRWGNSAAIRIPALVLAECELAIDAEVELRVDNGCIVINPIKVPEYDLAELVAQITSDNQHKEVDFGLPVGREVGA